MQAKVLFINPELGPVPRKRDDQVYLVAADNEALLAIAAAAQRAVDAGVEGAEVGITELEHRGTVTYKFVSIDNVQNYLERN